MQLIDGKLAPLFLGVATSFCVLSSGRKKSGRSVDDVGGGLIVPTLGPVTILVVDKPVASHHGHLYPHPPFL